MADFALLVGGREYSGFKSIRVTRDIETLSSSFELGFHEKWAGQNQPWPIRRGDECKVLFDGEPVISGYITSEKRSLTSSPSVTGKDSAADLVESAAMLDKWEYVSTAALDLARKVCLPFGVPVSPRPGLTLATIDKLSINPGDTAGAVLEKVCRDVGVLAISDGHGGLLLTRAGTDKLEVSLRQGNHPLLDGSATYTTDERFAEYRVLAANKKNRSVAAIARDETVRAKRKTIIRPASPITPQQAKERAEWEAAVRNARSATVSLDVFGWRQKPGGKLWPINKLVHVHAPRLDVIDQWLLISGAEYQLDDSNGQTTRLNLKWPGAFAPEPSIKKGTDRGDWKELRGGV